MKITVLAENSVCKTNLLNANSEHGLSLFIEFGDRKILFDTGQSDLFIQNAMKMGIDLSQVDYLIISHGHFDHGGGLKFFLNINKKAKIFLHENAIHKFYTRILGFIPYYVGLNQMILTQNADRISYIDKDLMIEDKIFLVEGFTENFPQPEANKSLFEKLNGRFIPDKFRHELALLLFEKDDLVLFSGCSHSGIVNIIEKAKSYSENRKIRATFGGFHIHNPINKKNESQSYIEKLTKELAEIDSIFYTCHCTGDINFQFIEEKLGKQIQSIKTGEVIEI
jgi:7,8-dihydropterin-6-yl-methyl-4-(beta-D-ribofuranosyl)aminobenzene 5'-phosphate synthase